MSKEAKKSVLRAILDDVYVAKNYDDAMLAIMNRLGDPNCIIRGPDAKLIVTKAQMCLSLPKLQQYITNSFLKFEGMGLR